jgi:tetratricopeptide (TPR) repeat protein
MGESLRFIKGLVILAVVVGGVIYLAWRSLKRNDEPLRLVARWILTGIVCYGIHREIGPMMSSGNGVLQGMGLISGILCGLVLAVIWAPSIIEYVYKKIEGLYTGGEEPPEPKPVYSGALAKRINGESQAAIYLIHEQLGKFPNDFSGQMILAEIQAVDQGDLAAAEVTVERVCQQPEHPPRAIAFALNSLADWYLSVAKSSDDARRILGKIPERFPDTEHSLQAAQRLAHLIPQEQLIEPQERKPIKLPPGRRDLGLHRVDPSELIKTVQPEEEVETLVAQLEKHPLDLAARERLAQVFAFDLRRLDLAADQIEQLIACPNVAAKQVAHWLNLLADFHTRVAGDLVAATAALQRIVELYPNSGLAEQARERIMRLPGESSSKGPAQTLKLGEYEQYVGLKMKPKTP